MLIIDDMDPDVRYHGGWNVSPEGNGMDGTLHGALTTHSNASLTFNGTGIHVVGALLRSDQNGQPSTVYYLDGIRAGSFDAPFTSPSDTQGIYNVTFFSRNNLSRGEHAVSILNVNGSDHTIFWLDYFVVDDDLPSPSLENGATSNYLESTSIPAGTQSRHTSFGTPSDASPSPRTSLSSSLPTSTQNPRSRNHASPTTVEPSTSSRSLTEHASGKGGDSGSGGGHEMTQSGSRGTAPTAVIVGAIIGGLLLLAGVATAFFRMRQRRMTIAMQDRAPVPDGSCDSRASKASPAPPPTSPRTSNDWHSSASTTRATIVDDIKRTERRLTFRAVSEGLSRLGPGDPASHTRAADGNEYACSSRTTRPPNLGSSSGWETDTFPPTLTRLYREEVMRSEWRTPVEMRTRAQSLLKAVEGRRERAILESEVDSGLRIYSESRRPPPYSYE